MTKYLLYIFLVVCTVTKAQTTKQYTNPILAGFYPDPSICRVGNDYYLVNSTFAYFPGIPIFHSRDLVNWKLIGHAMSRPEQMNLTGKGISRAIFAPTIRYHKGVFYITCTLIDDKGNFVVTSANPAGPWSNPHWLDIDGIDPSLFFDDNDRAYIVYNSIPPGNKSLYDGHRSIRINDFDYKNFTVSKVNHILVNGGTDLAKKPSWIEGPHLLKKYGYYYLVAAEGGTGFDHSEVAFRSKTLTDTFTPYINNPILTQRNADRSRKYPITSTGHADLVELPNGSWQAVFLGTRPYSEDYFNTGRETYLAPVTWKDEWPIINPGFEEVQYHYPLPLPAIKTATATTRYSGNFSYRDNFDQPLNPNWIFLRTPVKNWYNTSAKKGWLTLKVRPETAAGTTNPSFVARRQQHMNFTASTLVQLTTGSEHDKAGLTCFINETHFYFLAISNKGEKRFVQLYQSTPEAADSTKMILLTEVSLPVPSTTGVRLKVVAAKDRYAFYFGAASGWKLLKDGVDGRFLSTKMAGGFGANFVGNTLGLYATSQGNASTATAYFDWFEYSGNDEAFESK